MFESSQVDRDRSIVCGQNEFFSKGMAWYGIFFVTLWLVRMWGWENNML